MELNFVIQDGTSVVHMLEFLDQCPPNLQVTEIFFFFLGGGGVSIRIDKRLPWAVEEGRRPDRSHFFQKEN